ncbi:MAG: tyrosine-type recombinase/integrase [Desulfobacterales bacterium]
MAESYLTHPIEDFPKGADLPPFVTFQSGLSDPAKIIPNIPGTIELSRHERTHLARRKVLERFKQRLNVGHLPGRDYATTFLSGNYRHGLSVNTMRSNGSVILAFLSFLQASGRSIALSKGDLDAYIESEQDRGLAIASVNIKIRVLYSFISFLVDTNVVEPAILKYRLTVKMPTPLPRSIKAEDLEKLLTVLDDVRDRAMILLLLRTGMRIGELLELQVTDINLPERKIMIYIGEKNYQGRVVYFSDDAKEALLAWLAIRNPEKRYLFYGRGGPLSYVAAWYRITRCFKRAGLSHKSYSPHCLRHTFATEVLNAGMRLEVVQQLMGHLNIELTRRYAKLSDPTREEEYFRAMTRIEKGGTGDEPDRFNRQLQAVFEKKKLFPAHD